ncbi:hypothetical protein ACIQYG_19295 [Peribacillus sp. NPDC096622]
MWACSAVTGVMFAALFKVLISNHFMNVIMVELEEQTLTES